MDKSTELSSKLGHLLNIPPVSIEFLPGDGSEWLASAPAKHAPFLYIDNNLGVPHKMAYKAYLEAVARFRAVHSRDGPDVVSEVLASSAVLLVVNPAHQTALNARKRSVLSSTALPASHELAFTDALLTLREGAKQSILWAHRRWLLRRIYPSAASKIKGGNDGVDSLFGCALDVAAFRREFVVVERACETYPRNYHAWAHRFLCAEALVMLISESPSKELLEVLREEEARIKEWVERHVSDYSAMQYRCRLKVLIRDILGEEAESWGISRDDRELRTHAMELVRAYPSHESLWLYLRGAISVISSKTLDDEDGRLRRLVVEYLSSTGESAREQGAARVHAVRFAAWKNCLVRGHGHASSVGHAG